MQGKKSRCPTYNEITIKGIIVPVEWDESGNPIAIAIATHKEEEYLIVDKKGKYLDELLRISQQEIVMTGVMGGKIKNYRTIMIKNYCIIGS